MDPNNPSSTPPQAPASPAPSDLGTTPSTPPAPMPDLTATPPPAPSLEPQTPPPSNPFDPPAPPVDQPPQAGAISSPTPTPNPWDIPMNPSAEPSLTPAPSEAAPQTPAPEPLAPPAPSDLGAAPQTSPDNSWQTPSAPLDQSSATPAPAEPAASPSLDNSVYSAAPSQPSSDNFNNYSAAPQNTPTPTPVFDQTAADPNQHASLPADTPNSANTLSSLGIGGDLSQSQQASSPEPQALGSDPLHTEPSEPAPTDLSQLSGLGNPEPVASPASAPIPTETVTIPPAETSVQHEKTHKFPKLLLFGGIAVILLVILLSVYLFFIKGSSTPAPSSLPAQTTSDQLPLTSPPAPVAPQPAAQPLVASGSADAQGAGGFGTISPNGASSSGTPTHQSAFEAAKAREATSSASPAATP